MTPIKKPLKLEPQTQIRLTLYKMENGEFNTELNSFVVMTSGTQSVAGSFHRLVQFLVAVRSYLNF